MKFKYQPANERLNNFHMRAFPNFLCPSNQTFGVFMNLVNRFIIALFVIAAVNIAWGHGLPIYISSDHTSMITVSEAPFQDNYNLFVDEFGDPNDSNGLILTNEGSPYALSPPLPPAGYNVFPTGTTYTFNVTSLLYYSGGSPAAPVYVDPTNTTHDSSQSDASVYITIADENQSNPPTINVYGNALPASGYSFSANDDGHELVKILSNSSAPGAYGFGFTVTATLPGANSSITSAPLADVFFTDGFDNDEAATAVYNAIMRGDFNLDGQKNGADIAPMLHALTDLNSFQVVNSLSDSELLAIADVNQDGVVSNADLQALLDLLQGGGESTNSVPEPSGAVLGCGALIWLLVQRYRRRTRMFPAIAT
jgi:hypothetical protein